jgi:hypothetical protein
VGRNALEGERFDALSRALAQAPRRSLLRDLAAVAATAVAACTPARRPSEPSTPTERLGQAGPGMRAAFGEQCNPQLMKPCVEDAFQRVQYEFSACLSRCKALPDASKRPPACTVCFEGAELALKQRTRQCHSVVCAEGLLCNTTWLGSVGLPPRCCPPGHRVSSSEPHCVECHHTGTSSDCPPPPPPRRFNPEYCTCVCDNISPGLECPPGTSWHPGECRCV